MSTSPTLSRARALRANWDASQAPHRPEPPVLPLLVTSMSASERVAALMTMSPARMDTIHRHVADPALPNPTRSVVETADTGDFLDMLRTRYQMSPRSGQPAAQLGALGDGATAGPAPAPAKRGARPGARPMTTAAGSSESDAAAEAGGQPPPSQTTTVGAMKTDARVGHGMLHGDGSAEGAMEQVGLSTTLTDLFISEIFSNVD